MTQNQSLANEILGYTPEGYVCVVEECNTASPYRRVGGIYVDGRCVAMFDATKWLCK